MPIVSTELESVQTSSDGTILASFLAVDALGRAWRKSSSRFADVTAATVALNAFDWTDQLKDADFEDLLMWTQGLNDPETFDFTDRDLTLLEGEERLMVWFATKDGNQAVTISWWLDGLNTGEFNAIRNRVPYTGDQGSTITSRFTFLFQAEPWWDVIVEPD